MTLLRLLACLGLSFAVIGCASTNPVTKAEANARQVNLNDVRIGDKEKKLLAIFPKARLRPFGLPGRNVYEITDPNAHISLAVAYCVGGLLTKLELRYFDGPGAATLSQAGGWMGLRDYLILRFGQPTRVGSDIPLATEAGDLNPKYAKFDGEWSFPPIQRMIQYIAFTDEKGGGMGIVTFTNQLPAPPTVVPPVNRSGGGASRPAPTRVITTGPVYPGF